MYKYIVFKSDLRKVDNMDEWTSFSDIGKIFNNKVLTIDEYLLTENKYLKLFYIIPEYSKKDHFV